MIHVDAKASATGISKDSIPTMNAIEIARRLAALDQTEEAIRAYGIAIHETGQDDPAAQMEGSLYILQNGEDYKVVYSKNTRIFSAKTFLTLNFYPCASILSTITALSLITSRSSLSWPLTSILSMSWNISPIMNLFSGNPPHAVRILHELRSLPDLSDKDIFTAIYLTTEEIINMTDQTARITPAVFFQLHFSNVVYGLQVDDKGRTTLHSDQYDKTASSPIFRGFKYIKTFTPMRRFTTSHGATVRFMYVSLQRTVKCSLWCRMR